MMYCGKQNTFITENQIMTLDFSQANTVLHMHVQRR